jgi:hypothetical protein
MDFFLNLIFPTIFIILNVGVNLQCEREWNANKFIFITSGVFYFEVLLIIIQIRRLKAYLDEYVFIKCIRFLIVPTKLGLFIYSMICFDNDR